MDAIDILKEDHQKIKGLFREFKSAHDAKKKDEIARLVFHELDVHTQLEEQIFYPAVKEREDRLGNAEVGEAIHEHHLVDAIIGVLKEMMPGEADYDKKFDELMTNVEHHIEEEEGQMFPSAEEKLGDEMTSVTERMRTLKGRLTKMAA